MKKYFFFILLIQFNYSLAQYITMQNYKLSGEVMDEGDSLKGMSDVSIYNKTQKKSLITLTYIESSNFKSHSTSYIIMRT